MDSSSASLRELVVQLGNAEAELKVKEALYHKGEIGWLELNESIRKRRSIDFEVRRRTKRKFRDIEKELKAKYV